MGLTKAEELFLGVDEAALNDALTAFYNERHRYFDFGSTLGPTTASHTYFPPIALFPTVAIPWRITITLPKIDLHPNSPTLPLPPPLTLGPGQFCAMVGVTLTAAANSFTLQLFLVGHVQQIGSGSSAAIRLVADQAKIVGLPPGLATLLEGVLLLIVNAILAQATWPMALFSFGPLHTTVGPAIGSNQVELRGNL